MEAASREYGRNLGYGEELAPAQQSAREYATGEVAANKRARNLVASIACSYTSL